MKTYIKDFGRQEFIPYATLETLNAYTKEEVAKFGEATFDEVVQLTVIREKIFQESALLAATNDVVVVRAMERPDFQIFAPGDDAVRHTYPVPIERIGLTQRAEPITYNVQDVNLNMGETRYFLSDDAKIRGAFDWLQADSAARAAEHIAEDKDEHVLTELKSDAPASNDVAAVASWKLSSATPEDDLAAAISNIVENSNIGTAQFSKPNAFALIIPAGAFVGVTKLKLIRNITDTIGNFLETEYKVRIVLTRKPRLKDTWPIETEALVVPIKDSSIGFLGTWAGGGIVPSQERIRVGGRGDDIITRLWYKWTSIPEPLDGVVTTNARIAKITGVLT